MRIFAGWKHRRVPKSVGISPTSIRKPLPRQALTLMEIVMSTMIVGLMTVAALNGLGSAIRSGESAKNRSIAMELADDLMNAIQAETYADVDQYNGWNQQPPLVPQFGEDNGTELQPYRNPEEDDDAECARFARFRQRVVVENVSPSNPSQVVNGLDQGAKRICVTIEHDDVPLASRYAVVIDY